MSEFDFGEEQLKFLFERWKVKENLSETEKLAVENIDEAEELIQKADWIEARLNKYMKNLENRMEGSLDSFQDTDE